MAQLQMEMLASGTHSIILLSRSVTKVRLPQKFQYLNYSNLNLLFNVRLPLQRPWLLDHNQNHMAGPLRGDWFSWMRPSI